MLRTLSLLIFGALAFAAVLTPVIYSLLRSLWVDFPWPFSRVFNRVAMLGVLVMVLVLRRRLELRESLAFLRADWPRAHVRRLMIGFFCALCSGVLGLYLLVDGKFVLWSDHVLSTQLLKSLRWLPAAFLVAYIEEIFFRGLLFWRLTQMRKRNAYTLAAAVLSSSLLYAGVHFIVPQKSFVYTSFDPSAGARYLWLMFERVCDTGLLAGIAGLMLVGAILALVFWQTRSLSLCIGLHAGWALALKFANGLSTLAPGMRDRVPEALQGRYLLVAEPKVWLCLVAAGLLAYVWDTRYSVPANLRANGVA